MLDIIFNEIKNVRERKKYLLAAFLGLSVCVCSAEDIAVWVEKHHKGLA